MSEHRQQSPLQDLVQRVERALEEGRGRKVVEPLLERLARSAAPGSAERVFAHLHLAEIRLEIDPWSAALHLKKVLSAAPDNDVAHALMALAHALMDNHRSAVRAYRQAVRIAPDNPWYRHNLGHLLDAALGRPEEALPHLEIAYAAAQPPEHEITASLAHCLARLGRLEDAGPLARSALEMAPDHAEHRALHAWIQAGAPAGGLGKTSPRKGPSKKPSQPRSSDPAEQVAKRLASTMQDSPSAARLEWAMRVWDAYRQAAKLRVKNPAIYAAACHFAVTRTDGERMKRVAERYGVRVDSLRSRYNRLDYAVDVERLREP